MEYRLTLNERQLRAVQDALEFRFRIDLNQHFDLAEVLAHKGFDLSPSNPKHEQIFDTYIERKHNIEELLRAIFEISKPSYVELKQDEECLVMQDIWQVIRHQLWVDSGSHNMWTTDAKEPLPVSEENLPKIERVGE